MSVGVRCFQCKTELQGSGTGHQHASITGHTWQPGYYCTACEAMFSKHSDCEQHIEQVGVHGKRAPTKSFSAFTHRSSSSNASDRPPLKPVGRVPIVAAPKPGVSSSHVSDKASKTKCTVCQPPVTFLSRELLEEHLVRSSTSTNRCRNHLHELQNLQHHHHTSSSSVHPKCSDCGAGFLGDPERDTHRAQCPRAAAPVAQSTRCTSAPRSGLDGVSVASPSAGESGQNESKVLSGVGTTLEPSGLEVSSLPPNPSAMLSHHDTECIRGSCSDHRCIERAPSLLRTDVQGDTHEPPITKDQDSDSDVRVGLPQVNVALPKVDEGECKALSTCDGFPTPTTITVTLQGAQSTGANPLSFHCRSCLVDPSVDPVATLCGHIFCRRCILREFATRMCCPVCQRPSLIRLHGGVHS
ncbi:hypothetical protein LXA43DRAFT_997446 [Ganoderma leucocontextum]|nr:hypothetical protein LXA43DRAFT_997446 [Ganoderma leucocontextum]